MKPDIVIDFDGTLVESAWPDIGDWMPGAQDALWLISCFANIKVFTCRTAPVMPNGERRDRVEWYRDTQRVEKVLQSIGVPNIKLHTEPWKPSGFAYVDDRAVRYRGTERSWRNIVPKLAVLCDRWKEKK